MLGRWLAVKLDGSSKLIKTSRDEYKYIEDNHEMLIYVEFMGCWIYENSIDKWLPPHEAEFISEEKKKEILGKLCSFFERRKKTSRLSGYKFHKGNRLVSQSWKLL